MVQWSRAFGSQNFVTAGSDLHWVDGESQEDGLDAATGTNVVLHRVSGGTQQSCGALRAGHLHADVAASRITLGVRLDHWSNYNAHNLENTVAAGVLGAPTVNNNPDASRTDRRPSARRAWRAMYHLTDRINLWGDVNSGFRAPTLNELYRQFKKGTTTTLANYALVPERLVGRRRRRQHRGRAQPHRARDGVRQHVQNPVTNVTMTRLRADSRPATLPTARRRTCTRRPRADLRAASERRPHGDRRRSDRRGVPPRRLARDGRIPARRRDGEGERRRTRRSSATSCRRCRRIAAPCRSRTSTRRSATFAFDVQGVGAQFDDDLNTPSRVMPSYVTSRTSRASRRSSRTWTCSSACRTCSTQVYVVATLPTTIGSPRLFNGGVRIRWSGR